MRANQFEVIALDADDTLWHNETIFKATQDEFRKLLVDYHSAEWIEERLFETERRNLTHFGYGIKGFVLSMIETAIELTEGRITGPEVQQIIGFGKEMLQHPVDLLPGVEDTVRSLSNSHRLILLTKGDLMDQESKLARSGLGDCFSAVEVVSEKDQPTFEAVMLRQRVEAERFLMVGNSLRSDVLPALDAGGTAVHIPYQVEWQHEAVSEAELLDRDFARLDSLMQLLDWLQATSAGDA